MKLRELKIIILERVNEILEENKKIDRLINRNVDVVSLSENGTHVELAIETLNNGEDSIYI